MTRDQYIQMLAGEIYCALLNHEKFIEDAGNFKRSVTRATAMADELEKDGCIFEPDPPVARALAWINETLQGKSMS